MKSDGRPAHPPEAEFDAPEAPALRCPSCGAAAREGDRACAHCGSLLSTRRCAACFALSPRDADRCVKCGALLPEEAFEPAGGSCPDCRTSLVSRRAGVAGFSECPRCGGMFLTRASFDAVVSDAATREKALALDEAPAAAAPGTKFHYRKCPVCGQLMNRVNFGGGSGVITDVCKPHGAFLDRGELTRIVDFVEKGGWERVKKREILRMQEDLAALESRKRAAEGLGPPVAPFPSKVEERAGALSNVLRTMADFFL